MSGKLIPPRTVRGWLQFAGALGGLGMSLFYFVLVLRGQRDASGPLFVPMLSCLLLARAAAFWATSADTGTARRVWAVLAGLALAAGLLGVGASLAALVGLTSGIVDHVTLIVVGFSTIMCLATIAQPERTA